MLIVITIFILFFIGCFLIGRQTAKDSNSCLNLKKHPGIAKGILLFYIVFSGCFMFPLGSKPFPLDFSKLYLIITAYGIIGLGFSKLYGTTKERRVYLLSLSLTLLGMWCRYILEYGEVSNTYNFTLPNVILYIVLIPIFIVTIYHYIGNHLSKL